MWIVDTNKEHLAVEEARKLRIPIIGILDSNCDPDLVDFPIPGNDDAIRAVGLLTRVVADAVAEGLIARSGSKAGNADETVGAEEPLAEWERELLGGDAEKAAAAATGDAAAETPAAESTGAASEAPQADAAADAVTEAPAETATEAPAETATEAPAEAPAATEAADRGARRGPRRDRGRRHRGARRGRGRQEGLSRYAGRGLTSAAGAPRRPTHRRVASSDPRTPWIKGRRTMANFTAADVKKLRETTQAGMMDCKKALDRGRRRLRQGRRAAPRQGCRQGRRPRRRARGRCRPRRHLRQRPGRAQERDRLRRQERGLHRQGAADRRCRRLRQGHRHRRPSRPPSSTARPSARSSRTSAITIGEKIELGRGRLLRGHHRHLHAQACRRPAAGRRCAGRVRG